MMGGRLAVVGIGPGDAGGSTPEAARRLAGATDLVGYRGYLDRVPPGPPGQARHGSGNGQEAQRARLALDLAADGRDVAVVSSGDPGVFAMASAVVEELHRCAGDPRYAALDVAVVAGVTAATAAAARRGAILGHDFCVVSCSDLHKPLEVVERRVDAAARADFVVALYNPASSARPHQLEVILSAITRHRHPDTPVVVARDVARPAEDTRVATLATLETTDVDMRTVVIVGSSTTRRFTDAVGRDWVYTPRRYPAG